MDKREAQKREAQVWLGEVATVSPDNLASHSIGGFKESCSVNRLYWQCMATQESATIM